MDWEVELAKMATIYEQSFLTIAASSSPSSDHSFLDGRNNTMWEPLTIKFPDDSGQLTMVKARFMPRTGIHDLFGRSRDPWDMRAWTLQEKLLSTRLVSYSEDEMQWSCKTLSTCECEAGFGRDWAECPRSPFQLECDSDAYMFWQVQVMDYSKRRLTDPKDKLPAISGLASRIHQVTGSEYVAGLWAVHFVKDLFWERIGEDDWEPEWKLPSSYRAPTFSWASVDGSIFYGEDVFYQDWTYHTKVLESSCKLSGTSRFGQLESCSVKVCGPCFRASLSRIQDRAHTLNYSVSVRATVQDFTADVALEEFTFYNSLGFPERSARRSGAEVIPQLQDVQVCVLDLAHYCEGEKENYWHYCLVLGRSPRDFNAYERLGSMRVYCKGLVEQWGWPQLNEEIGHSTVTIF
jgi:hypothetical protein